MGCSLLIKEIFLKNQPSSNSNDRESLLEYWDSQKKETPIMKKGLPPGKSKGLPSKGGGLSRNLSHKGSSHLKSRGTTAGQSPPHLLGEGK